MRGDMNRWLGLAHIAPDFTLMQPFGGPASHGFDANPGRLAELARFFKNGETSLEVAQTYASDGLVVLVMIERQQAEVRGLPNQNWSLRVTEVYRNDGSEWQSCIVIPTHSSIALLCSRRRHLLPAGAKTNDGDSADRELPSGVTVGEIRAGDCQPILPMCASRCPAVVTSGFGTLRRFFNIHYSVAMGNNGHDAA